MAATALSGSSLVPTPRLPSPISYTPRHLADKILTSRSALEGERKQVTVLFADVKGSMDLAGKLDPEEWHRVMDGFFAILTGGVHRFEGTVNQYTGDGIMALFGAPIAHEDHAHRACYTALHLLEELRPYANQLRLRQGLNFSVRMGINSGEVIVGRIGDDLRMDYTAQGHTVGLAARMEQIAEAGKVYLTEHAAALVKGFFQLGDLGRMEVKGVAEPLRVYELQGVGQMRTRLDISRSRGFSRFVGRAEEMQVLEAALARAQQGQPQIVGIVGEAGLGKSRLCAEFIERCRASGIMTYEATGVSHGRTIPFLPILQLCRAFFGISEQDSDTTARERIAGRLLLLDERFRESLPLMFDFLGVPDPELPAPRMDPEARQRQIFAVFRGVIEARGQRETSVTLLEDLHWFDGGSEAFLEPLLDSRPGNRGLIMVNFRPEYRADWARKSYYQQVALQPLGPDALRQLLADLLGSDASISGLAETIHARTAGNPFFTEEVIQTLIESGKLVGNKGSYRLVAPIDRLEVPGTVQALLAARIDRLPEREKQVLQTAAVIGKTFPEPTLRSVAGLSDAALAETLHLLRSAEFIYEQALYPVAEYAFKHPLTQEVAYGSQLQERRRQIHAAVAAAIEATRADKLDEQAALLAHHCTQAGEALAAAQWHARAAGFFGSSNVTESARHWQQAREVLRDVADDPRAPELGANACFHLLGLGFRQGVPEPEAQAVFREGLDWAARTDDPLWAGRLQQAMSVFESGNNRFDAGLRHGLEWERIVRSLPDAERRACALWPTLVPLLGKGDLATLRINCRQQIAATEAHPEWGMRDWGVSALADVLNSLAWVELRDGTLEQARALLERSLEVSRRLNNEVEVWCLGVLGDLGFLAGDPELSRAAIDRSVRICEPLGVLAHQIALSRLGRQLLLEGRAAEAVEALEHAQSFSRDGNRTQELFVAQALAQARLEAGEPAPARVIAEAALDASLELGARLSAIDSALVLSAALRAETGLGAASRIEAVLATADRLIAETGA